MREGWDTRLASQISQVNSARGDGRVTDGAAGSPSRLI